MPWKNMIRGIAFVLLGVGILLYFFGSGFGTPDLRVTKQVTGTQEESVTVTNIGQSPITIRSGSINGKEIKEMKPAFEQVRKQNPTLAQVWPLVALKLMDGTYGCAFTVANGTWDSMWPVTLGMGQSVDFSFTTVCGTVVSAIFYTDRGTGIYNWK